MYYVYVLKSVVQDRLYIGVSEDVEKRLRQHNAGRTFSTRPYVPFVLLYSESYINKSDALRRERQIKRSGKIRKDLKEGTYMPPSSNG